MIPKILLETEEKTSQLGTIFLLFLFLFLLATEKYTDRRSCRT
jgi:hypothetical protein